MQVERLYIDLPRRNSGLKIRKIREIHEKLNFECSIGKILGIFFCLKIHLDEKVTFFGNFLNQNLDFKFRKIREIHVKLNFECKIVKTQGHFWV